MIQVISAANTYDLTTLATFKEEAEVSGTADDQFISQLIRQASGDIARYCNRTFAAETVRETFRLDERWNDPGHGYPGTAADGACIGANALLLQRLPVLDLISVKADGVTVPLDEVELDPEPGILRRVNDGWQAGWWNPKVVVEYRAGYELLAGLPYEVERACLDLVKARYFQRSRDPALRSERILDLVDTSWTATSSGSMKRGLPADIAERLDSFRRLSL
jgi:hypothetical protein